MNGCASGFVCDLIDDAVDDFADDLVHDVDDVYYCIPSSTTTPVKAISISDAQLVLSAGEPAISEEVDEDEDICEAAVMLTARAAEEAITAIAPGSPSWSMHANAPSLINFRQLDFSAAVVDDGELSCDGYEDVYSLASEEGDELDSDEEIESMAYVKLAVNLAKNAVSKGCIMDAESEADESDHEEAKAAARDALCAALLGARCENGDEVDLEEAKAAARDALCSALLGGATQCDQNVQELEEVEVDEKHVEFLGEGPACGMELAFDYTSSILDGAFTQAASTWEEQNDVEDDEDDELEQLRLQAMASLTKGVQNGQLEEALNTCTRERELATLKAKARETLLKFAQEAAVHRQKEEEEVRTLAKRAKDALSTAAEDGRLASTLKTMREAKEMKELKAKVQETLYKAAREGRLASTLRSVAPKTEIDNLKSMALKTLSKAAANGSLSEIFREIAENRQPAAVESAEIEKDEVPEPVAESPPAAVAASPKPPATPTRNRRRIIGGVVRTPSAMELDLDMPSASPASDMGSSRRPKSHRKKEAPKAFRLDLGEEEEETSTPWARASSLTRGYDTLGAQFHSLDQDSPSSSSAPKMMLQHPKLEAFANGGAPAFDRPSSKAGSRLRQASTSALAMDLGGDFMASTSSRSSTSNFDAFRSSFAPKAFGLKDQPLRQSASLGSLQMPKVSKGGLLPMLATTKATGESIAWTMHNVKSTSKWGNTGLRGSASMVF
jgi:hypothetical protein